MNKKISRPLIVFYGLVGYVFLQFGWWAYHIFELHTTVYTLQLQQGTKTDISARLWMIVGEGTVFFLLLILGAIITRNSFKKEVTLGNQQRNFLLSVTHELKSPVASIKLFIETLLKRDVEKERQKEILLKTLKETERLLSLVENILFSARIESGNFSLYKEKINISALTKEIAAIPAIESPGQKKQHFIISIEPDIFFNVDKQAWSSVVLNLVENAVKYSPPTSTISVQLKKDRHRLLFSVTDEGAGISESEVKNIFKKFYRIGNEHTRKSKGTGLGLYIVKYLVEQLGGAISVKNNLPKGSIFEVSLES